MLTSQAKSLPLRCARQIFGSQRSESRCSQASEISPKRRSAKRARRQAAVLLRVSAILIAEAAQCCFLTYRLDEAQTSFLSTDRVPDDVHSAEKRKALARDVVSPSGCVSLKPARCQACRLAASSKPPGSLSLKQQMASRWHIWLASSWLKLTTWRNGKAA